MLHIRRTIELFSSSSSSSSSYSGRLIAFLVISRLSRDVIRVGMSFPIFDRSTSSSFLLLLLLLLLPFEAKRPAVRRNNSRWYFLRIHLHPDSYRSGRWNQGPNSQGSGSLHSSSPSSPFSSSQRSQDYYHDWLRASNFNRRNTSHYSPSLLLIRSLYLTLLSVLRCRYYPTHTYTQMRVVY